MPAIQVLPNGDQLHFGADGSVNTVRQGIGTADLMGMMTNRPLQDPRAGVFGPFAGAGADMYGSYAGVLGTGINAMGRQTDAYANALAGYGNVLARMSDGGGMNNSDAARYGAYSKNTSDYQNLLGALGVGALGAYGNASNAALQSQAARDTAAMKMFADAAAANQSALASYGGQQAAAQAATANAASTAGQGLAAGRGNMGAAAANAATGLGAARSGLGSALAGLGSAGMGALANVSGNALNYTRDMAKLDLQRALGTGSINAIGNIASGLSGGFNSPGGMYSISGPAGGIASTPGTGASGGGGVAGGAAFNPGGGWYSSPQFSDGGGTQSVLGALASSQAAIGNQAAGVDRDAANVFRSIDPSGIDRDALASFTGINQASDRIADRSVLDSLNQNYGRSWNDMMSMYTSGRQDPKGLLQDIYKGALGITSPFLTAGREAFGTTMNNLPKPTSTMQDLAGGYLSGLNSLIGMQNQNIINTMNTGQQVLGAQMQNLNSGFGGTMNILGNSPYGGNMGGAATGFIKKYINGQEVWEPVGPGIYSPESDWAQKTYGTSNTPGYTQSSNQGGGFFNMPAYGGMQQPAAGTNKVRGVPSQSQSGVAPNVQRAQDWASDAQMQQRWDYYKNRSQNQIMADRFNPGAQEELNRLQKWRNG